MKTLMLLYFNDPSNLSDFSRDRVKGGLDGEEMWERYVGIFIPVRQKWDDIKEWPPDNFSLLSFGVQF